LPDFTCGVGVIHFPLLSFIIFLPLIGCILSLALWRHPNQVRWASLTVLLMDMGLALFTLSYIGAKTSAGGGLIFVEDVPWVDSLGIRYSLSLDGISLILVLLTTFLGVVCVLISWREIESGVGAFHFFILLTQTGVLGVFLAADLFLFYLFWELQLVPMFFLIGIWGHDKELRIQASIKFFIDSITGSLLMLIAIIGLYIIHGSQTGNYSFALAELMRTALEPATEMWLFSAFLLAFAIKVPMFPLHTWLPDAHTEAPTAGSVDLAGLLLKTGAYGILRFAVPLFPLAAARSAPLLLSLGLLGVFYAAWIALAQNDMKRLVAYSSIGHMGLIIIGIAVWSNLTLSGAILLMINHGLTTSALFVMIGMLAERTHSRDFADLGSIWKEMPVFSGFFLLFGLASLGLPGLNNFVSEILILVGTFQEYPVIAIIAFFSMVFVLVYVLRMVQSALFGQARKKFDFWDVTPRETLILISFALLVLFLGLHPQPLLKLLSQPVQALLDQTGRIMTARLM